MFELPESKSLSGGLARAELGGEIFSLETADSDVLRERGLSGRDSIPPQGGMLFLFPRPGRYAFWMKNMRFAVDIIWLRGDRIVFIQKNAAPPAAGTAGNIPRYISSEDADKIIEIQAGTAERLGLGSGQQVKILLP